jgi:hypothetical protein
MDTQTSRPTHDINGAEPQDANGGKVKWDAFQNFNPNAAANMGTLKPGASVAGPGPQGEGSGKVAKTAKKSEEEETETEEPKEMQEHLNALFNGESLTEDFMNKAKTIFEAAVNERVNVLREQVLAEAAAVVQEEVETAVNELAERLDDYLGYVVEEWMEENQLAVENGIRTEIAENFMSGLKELFETHYIEVPQEKYDVVDGLFAENEELESSLNEQIQNNIEMQKELLAYQAGQVFAQVADGLTDVEVEKFASLAEGVDFDSLEQYQEKLNVLKESYFNAAPTVTNIVEETTNKQMPQEVGSSMGAYLSTLDRLAKSNKL